MKRDQIAIQMYTLRGPSASDFDATLARVAGIGYTAVEFAGFHDLPAAQIRNILQANGLRAAAAHIPLTAFQESFEGVAEDLVTIGAGWGIVPWVAPDDRTEETLRGYAEQFNQFAQLLKPAGVKFAYHNHDVEFSDTTADGKTLFDTLVGITTPGEVFFELDAFWAAVGGHDPETVIRANLDRIGLVHLKDGNVDDLDRGKDVPFGEGDLDWDGILAASREAGVSWYVTEQDNPSADDPFGDVERALRNAERMAQ